MPNYGKRKNKHSSQGSGRGIKWGARRLEGKKILFRNTKYKERKYRLTREGETEREAIREGE